MLTLEQAKKMARDAFKDGRLIEASWIVTLLREAPEGTTDEEIIAMRYAFYSGARCMMATLLNPPGKTVDEKTEAMNEIVDNLKEELLGFAAEWGEKHVSNNLH